MSTNYRRVTRTLDRWLDDTGRSREDIAEALGARITTDPLALAPYVDAERVLMIMTRTDAIVPFDTQQALWREHGRARDAVLADGASAVDRVFPEGPDRGRSSSSSANSRPQRIAAAR